MKSLKYVVISLLILSIFKKTVPAAQEAVVTNSESVQTGLKNTKHSDREIETKKQHKKRYRSTIKKYSPDKKTATVDNVYVGVEEHGQATTPPNSIVPAMVPFGTITEKHTPKEKQLLGGKINITTLWGVPVYGHRKPIKETERNLTIGYLWLNQDSILGIAQMNDGKTFVGVMDDHMPNYIKTDAVSHKKTGLVWDWYTHQDITDLQEKYGVEIPGPTTVKEIGMAKINRQRYKLYGLKLPDFNDYKSKIVTAASNSFTSKMNLLNSQKPNLFNLHGNEPTEEIHPLILNYLAKHWFNKNKTD
jgi:hypothetical protein